MATSSVTSVRFYFDPGCPWTWVTSRWIVDAAAAKKLPITWSAMSLAILNAGREIPEQYRAGVEQSTMALRVVTQLGDQQRNDEVGAFYTALGEAWHVEQMPRERSVLEKVMESVGLADLIPVLDDVSADAAVKASHDKAVSVAGPDVGSPVMVFEPHGAAIFGPIVSPAPAGEQAVEVFDAVVSLAHAGGFYELKRGRTGPPQFG